MPQPTLVLPRSGSPRLVLPSMAPPGCQDDYAQRILHTRPGNLIAYWPLDEQSGAVAHDLSGNAFHGVYTGVDLMQPGIGDGRTSPYFDGTNDYVNIYSAAFNAAWAPTEMTALGWAKMNASVWQDGTYRHFFILQTAAAQNRLWIRRHASGNGRIEFYQRATSATAASILVQVAYRNDWVCFAISASLSANQVKPYIDGVLCNAPVAFSGTTWNEALAATTTCIGAGSTVPVNSMLGNIAHCALWNCALTPQEMGILGRQP